LEDAATKQVVDPRNPRHDVEEAGRDEQFAREHTVAVADRHPEAARRAARGGHGMSREPHARIGQHLASRDVEEARGRNAVAR
jgi:hypothetical protein